MQTYEINLHGKKFEMKAKDMNDLRVNLLKTIRWGPQRKYAEVSNGKTGFWMGGLHYTGKGKPKWFYPRYFMEEQSVSFVSPKTGRLSDKHLLGDRPEDGATVFKRRRGLD